MNAVDAARAFLAEQFPDALAAILGGSVVRGDATPTSDLDILILTERKEAPYRESFCAFGWPVEAFIHTRESYRQFFASDAQRRRPSLPRICHEGLILIDTDGLAAQVKAEATELWTRGPDPLTEAEVSLARYMLTDQLDDFIGSDRPDESMFIAGDLANAAAEFVLSYHRRWIGKGKWVPRALSQLDPALSERLTAALGAFYRTGDKSGLVAFVEAALAPAGGRLFAGFSLGTDR